jgi:fibronectin type III domain protein/subtilase family protein
MVLVNTSTNSLNADFHYVPTVHLADTDRAAVKAYAGSTGATATIQQAALVFNVPAPATASFSSRGPLLAAGGDLLKPDVIAPGQDILAAVAPPGNGGLSFNVYSGTSMAAPHVAGVAALLRQMHPDWSPMMIKSALMTSASDVIDGPNTNATVIFRQGAGHIRPTEAADPGLVYDSEFNDWLALLCGATDGVNPALCSQLAGAGYSFDASDLNVASIAIGDLVASETVTRRVTNVGDSRTTYVAQVTGMTGVTVKVTPSVLTLRRGETKAFKVTFTTSGATLGTYTGGQLRWTDGTHTVRSPLVVKPMPLSAPPEVSSTGDPISYKVKFGYTGPFTAAARGLIPAVTHTATITDDPDNTFTPDPAAPGTVAIPVTIAAGTTYARFSLFDSNVTPASDLDLYLFKGSVFVAGSGSGTSNEEVDVLNPPAGNDYVLYVHGFNVPGTSGATFQLFSWLLGSAPAGNMTVAAPTTATAGSTGTITLTFSGLAPATKYLGSVAYGGASGLPNPTIVRVDTP